MGTDIQVRLGVVVWCEGWMPQGLEKVTFNVTPALEKDHTAPSLASVSSSRALLNPLLTFGRSPSLQCERALAAGRWHFPAVLCPCSLPTAALQPRSPEQSRAELPLLFWRPPRDGGRSHVLGRAACKHTGCCCSAPEMGRSLSGRPLHELD